MKTKTLITAIALFGFMSCTSSFKLADYEALSHEGNPDIQYYSGKIVPITKMHSITEVSDSLCLSHFLVFTKTKYFEVLDTLFPVQDSASGSTKYFKGYLRKSDKKPLPIYFYRTKGSYFINEEKLTLNTNNQDDIFKLLNSAYLNTQRASHISQIEYSDKYNQQTQKIDSICQPLYKKVNQLTPKEFRSLVENSLKNISKP